MPLRLGQTPAGVIHVLSHHIPHTQTLVSYSAHNAVTPEGYMTQAYTNLLAFWVSD